MNILVFPFKKSLEERQNDARSTLKILKETARELSVIAPDISEKIDSLYVQYWDETRTLLDHSKKADK